MTAPSTAEAPDPGADRCITVRQITTEPHAGQWIAFATGYPDLANYQTIGTTADDAVKHLPAAYLGSIEGRPGWVDAETGARLRGALTSMAECSAEADAIISEREALVERGRRVIAREARLRRDLEALGPIRWNGDSAEHRLFNHGLSR